MKEQTVFVSDELDIDRRERVNLPARRLKYRPVSQRRADFKEACQHFTRTSAIKEAARCIECPAPQACVIACPLHNDIPHALWHISQGDFLTAAHIYRQTSTFPELCGRLCPDESLCVSSCGVSASRTPVRLGRLEAMVCDIQRESEGFPLPARAPKTGKRVAVIGSGPAGLTAVEELAKYGHEVTVFEMRTKPGGMLAYAIPRFRLPLDIIESKIAQLESMGVRFVLHTRIGKDTDLEALLNDGFQAVFLGTGASFEPKMNIPGADLAGVHRATGFLLRTNLDPTYSAPEETPTLTGQVLMRADDRVAIIGGGHSAVDCARTAIRLGARQVFCIFPGREQEMTCRMEDKFAAEEEGVKFLIGVADLELTGNAAGHVEHVTYRPGAQDDRTPKSGGESRRGSVAADFVVLAPERAPHPRLAEMFTGIRIQPSGWIEADRETGQTAVPGVFAAGDNVGQTQLVVEAIARARQVAGSMHRFLSEARG